jgi:hypothetical protein
MPTFNYCTYDCFTKTIITRHKTIAAAQKAVAKSPHYKVTVKRISNGEVVELTREEMLYLFSIC